MTLGGGSTFIGNLLADASITTVSGTNLTGRLLAVTGAVTLDTNIVNSPGLTPAQLLNISTRLHVLDGDRVDRGFTSTALRVQVNHHPSGIDVANRPRSSARGPCPRITRAQTGLSLQQR